MHLLCIGLGEVSAAEICLKTNFKDAALFATDGVDIIMLCRGDTISGKPYYAFLKVKPSRFSAFEQAQAGGDAFSLQEYGEIIEFDYTITPPEDVINAMRARYGGSL